MSRPLFSDIDIAESALRKGNRHVLEHLREGWEDYEPYADNNYHRSINQVIHDLHKHVNAKEEYIKITDRLVELSWEMTTALALLKLGLELVSSKDKPLKKNKTNLDHLMIINGKRIWIECVTPARGDDDSFPDPDKDGTYNVPVDAMKLRITNSIDRKAGPPRQNREYSQIRQFVTEYPECKLDPILLAINTANLRFDSNRRYDLPIACCSVFGFGSAVYECPKAGGDASYAGHQHVASITKPNGKSVSMESFKSVDYRFLSGLLYSVHSPFGIGLPNFDLIENAKASNCIPSAMNHIFSVWRFDLSANRLTCTPRIVADL